MKSTETLTALKKLKVDCLYSKDTQFNAATRIHLEASRFRIFLVIGTVFASFSTIMNVGLWEKIAIDTQAVQVVVNLLGALGGFLILYTTTFSDHNSKRELSIKHRNVGDSLNLLFKKIRLTEAAFLDNLLNDQELLKKIEEYSLEYYSIFNSAPQTLEGDFLKAKSNVGKGYAEYTKEELDI